MPTTPDQPCPDCGDDPNERGYHRARCRRVAADKHGLDPRLQFGPPWLPWPDDDPTPKIRP
jgi:hypothetical protein